MSSQRYTV